MVRWRIAGKGRDGCGLSIRPPDGARARAKLHRWCRPAGACAVLRAIGNRQDDDMQKITPFLWFDHQAEEAAHWYAGIFKRSKVTTIARYGDAGPGRRAA
jgi:hypothetical protein